MSEQAGRILALDVGTKRIGVAISDVEQRLASPLCVVRRKNRDTDIIALRRLVAEHKPVLIVVGLPLATGDRVGESAKKAMSLGKRLAKATGLEVVYQDEAETTVEAMEAMLTADLSRAKQRDKVDKVAASLILSRYLQTKGAGA